MNSKSITNDIKTLNHIINLNHNSNNPDNPARLYHEYQFLHILSWKYNCTNGYLDTIANGDFTFAFSHHHQTIIAVSGYTLPEQIQASSPNDDPNFIGCFDNADNDKKLIDIANHPNRLYRWDYLEPSSVRLAKASDLTPIALAMRNALAEAQRSHKHSLQRRYQCKVR